jgi:hypothetical protein
MQGAYHCDKPFFDALETFFVVTAYQAAGFEILRKYDKNWMICRTARSIAATPLWRYL